MRMEWYAIFVTTGKEEYVADWLQIMSPESIGTTLIPKRKLIERRQGKSKQVLKKMFPGYVLVNIDMDFRVYYILKKIPNLVRILNSGDYYSRIDPEEMVGIHRLLGDGDVIDYSKVYFMNSKVVVKSGPLEGMEGLIKKVDQRKLRAKIEVRFMGEPKEIDVGIEILNQVDG